jgi:hypothetical protein
MRLRRLANKKADHQMGDQKLIIPSSYPRCVSVAMSRCSYVFLSTEMVIFIASNFNISVQ